MSVQEWLEKDYYAILGVDKKASDKEIRRQYRRLAKQYHPDYNKNANAEEKFKEISEAYNVLSQSDKRKEYDEIRESMSSGFFSRTPGSGYQASSNFSGFPRFNQENVSYTFTTNAGGAKTHSFDDFLSGFFNRREYASPNQNNLFTGQARNQDQRQATNKSNLKRSKRRAKVRLSVKQAYNGAIIQVPVDGEVYKVRVNPGAYEGQRLAVRTKDKDGNPIELVVSVTVPSQESACDSYSHSQIVYSMTKDGLLIEIPLSPDQAYFGTNLSITLPDESKTSLEVPQNTTSGDVISKKIKKQEAMLDIKFSFSVHIPKMRSSNLDKIYRKLQEIYEN